MKKVISGLAIAVIVFFSVITLTSAHNNGGCDWNDCKTPTPTVTPTPSCYLTVEHQRVYYPCPTPTKPICNEDHPCVTPTVTPTATPSASPTPSATPSATPSDNSGGGSSGGSGGNNPPPVAQCGTPFDIPNIVSFTDKGGGTINVAWTEDQGNLSKYSITYGYSADNLNMGEDNIPGNVLNWDIHDLAPGNHVWVQVQAWLNGCEESSNVFDPVVQ
jgi:hypothetical protein